MSQTIKEARPRATEPHLPRASVMRGAGQDAREPPARAGRGRRFAINGKFASQRMTGVQRVGYELAMAFARLFPLGQRPTLLLPANAQDGVVYAGEHAASARLDGSLWEQFGLPWAVGERVLLSLCNIGPLFARRQVLMVHDVAVYDLPGNYSWKYRLWYRFAYAILKRTARHIVTVSEFSKHRIMARLDLPASRISVVHNGVDHFDRIVPDNAVLSRLNLQPDNYVLIVGSLSVGKNLARVLAAVAQLEGGHDWQFVVVGGFDLRVFNAREKAQAVVSNDVVMAGFVSDGELKALYEQAGCFLFPSLYEGFGLPPLEAMSCGCPVIASREAALPEVCGNAALYCDARSVEDIAAKVVQMMTDPELRESLSVLGRARAGDFRWDAAACRLLDIVEREVPAGR